MVNGETIGPYTILTKLGEGGMGAVFRARDTKLDRDVAIKILPEAFAHDADRLARFTREAKTLASLNHPHIAAIYGLEESNGITALVMELVDGDDLSQRIAQAAIPLDEALPIARQIAEALEAAHEQGVIHRDLKPANIKVRSDGTVKVLDFGLAKAMEQAPGSGLQAPGLSQSPTITSPAPFDWRSGGPEQGRGPMTQAGMILGTAAYMAPEQARGKTVDKRADIWAFGAVLFEMLTGKRAFAGDDVSITLASVLMKEPEWSALPPDTPAPIRTLLRRCLEKDRTKRVADMAVAQFLLNDEGATAPDSPRLPPTPSRGAPLVVASLAVAAAAVAVAGWMAFRSAPAAPIRSATRFRIGLPPGLVLLNPSGTGGGAPLGLSADGNQLAYFARLGVTGDFQLYTKSRNQLEPVPIRGARSSNGSKPFFSPDGAWIVFSANGKLKKVPVAGGGTLDLCDATGPVGGTWLPDDSIVFASTDVPGLQRISSTGGTPTVLTTPDGKTESAHRWPEALPGGKAVVFVIQRPDADFGSAAIGVLRLDTLEWSVILEGGVAPHYLLSGHLAFVRNGVMLAVPFDLETLRVTGAPAQLLDGLTENVATGEVKLAVSPSGTVAYVPDGPARRNRALTWVDRTGNAQTLPVPHQPFEAPRLSPDGQQVALGINNGASGGERNIWIYDFARHNLSRLTSEKVEAETPVWTPDGRRVSYATARSGTRQFMWKPGDGSGTDEVLASDAQHLHFGGFSPSGDVLIANAVQGPDTGSVWMFRRGSPWTLTRYPGAGSQVSGPVVSPDGRWLAYASRESNRYDIYVQRFPDGGARYSVSSGGGTEPVWARSGRELFYRNGDRMMAVSIDTKGNTPQIGTPTILFQEVFAGGATNAWYDVSPDGQRFLMLKPDDASASDSIVVIQDWMDEIKGLMSRGK